MDRKTMLKKAILDVFREMDEEERLKKREDELFAQRPLDDYFLPEEEAQPLTAEQRAAIKAELRDYSSSLTPEGLAAWEADFTARYLALKPAAETPLRDGPKQPKP